MRMLLLMPTQTRRQDPDSQYNASLCAINLTLSNQTDNFFRLYISNPYIRHALIFEGTLAEKGMHRIKRRWKIFVP
jgi:hypothetical protein